MIEYKEKIYKVSGKYDYKRFSAEIDLLTGKIFIHGSRLNNSDRNAIAKIITMDDPRYINLWKLKKSY